MLSVKWTDMTTCCTRKPAALPAPVQWNLRRIRHNHPKALPNYEMNLALVGGRCPGYSVGLHRMAR
jgi:hypothetical protein